MIAGTEEAINWKICFSVLKQNLPMKLFIRCLEHLMRFHVTQPHRYNCSNWLSIDHTQSEVIACLIFNAPLNY